MKQKVKLSLLPYYLSLFRCFSCWLPLLRLRFQHAVTLQPKCSDAYQLDVSLPPLLSPLLPEKRGREEEEEKKSQLRRK
jgi:hypothetical protein